jgi:hypothetical protein
MYINIHINNILFHNLYFLLLVNPLIVFPNKLTKQQIKLIVINIIKYLIIYD